MREDEKKGSLYLFIFPFSFEAETLNNPRVLVPPYGSARDSPEPPHHTQSPLQRRAQEAGRRQKPSEGMGVPFST